MLDFSIRNFSVAATESRFAPSLAPYYMGLKHNWRNVGVLMVVPLLNRSGIKGVMLYSESSGDPEVAAPTYEQ